ncbi:MAG: YMGG-like glycine zipper-containing protein [Pyrinomonadaceae bacterium]
MSKMRNGIFALALIALASMSVTVEAQRRPIRRAQAPTIGQNLRVLISRIENNTALFQNSLNQNGINNANAGDNFNQTVTDFRSAVSRLRGDYNARVAVNNDVQTVISFATNIDNYLLNNRLDARTETYWANIRPDLNQLARIYGVPYSVNAQAYPSANQGNNFPNNTNQGNNGSFGTNRLTGTYRLNVSRSDNARDAAERATRNLPLRDRQNVANNLASRLEAPDTLALDVRGRTVTLASSRAPQITFDADGRVRNEQMSNGRNVRASASLFNDQLIVNSTGDRANDYSVTFDALENGRRLRVTRRVSSDRLTQPVVVQSFYDKTADVAQFDIYNNTQQPTYTGGNTNTTDSDFVIPNNTQLVAVLNENVSTKQSREGDRFTMTVRDPSQYSGAIIEGNVSRVNPSGRITGRSQLQLNFERIRYNGRTYNFAGIINSIRTTNGEDARVDNEGTVQQSTSQTTKTEQRAAIGTGIGAIIGAIAGGGKGAAIGAIVGATGGAGSVYVQGRDDLELINGTEFTIRTSAPASFGR